MYLSFRSYLFHYSKAFEKRKTLFLEIFLCSVVFQHIVAFFPEVTFGFLGADPQGRMLIGDAVTLQQTLDPGLFRSGDGYGHIAHFSQTAVEQFDGIDWNILPFVL